MVNAEAVSHEVMRAVVRHRRRARNSAQCATDPCDACLLPHLGTVRSSVESGAPIVFVLPGFPCKSPNPSKVLGVLPDMAEELALDFLDSLCRRIGEIHAPGAHVVICSDGRVFSDLINVPDEHVTAYHSTLQRIIDGRHAQTLSQFSIDDLPRMRCLPHDRMRRMLDEIYAEAPEEIRREVRGGGEPLRLYRAITRFLFEDGLTPGRHGSRRALQRDARQRAYGVIRRSRAWGALVADRYPSAVRLSIHPQSCGSAKFGIRLTAENDDWLTPWHGVAVEMDGRFVLRGRAEAERIGARLVHRDGRPSHYTTTSPHPPDDESRLVRPALLS
ncbi:L-tyrosine/L-tryptophan isonitrile synthase family protein [Streptomyces sp. KR80]|uniref:L-tyrosine/L-tryptophan isonitrile synthase family protein n=1 Tax=Streptomyces sp. KR80 TaxID=3457426 RepID=UPI003FD3E363